MPTEAQKKATKKYHDKLAGITIRVSQQEKEFIDQAADEFEESIKDYLVQAAHERIERKHCMMGTTSFTPPSGEWCTEECKKRCTMIPAVDGGQREKQPYEADGVPWCAMYCKEITDRDQKTGQYHKCSECLHNTQ